MALSELTPLVERGYYGAQTSLDELQNKIADQNKLRESPPSPSASADITAGLGAYQSGDYATALRELTPLAKQGDARAQFSLGVMYEDGKGVPQDYKTAVKWYRLAAEQGDADAQFLLEYLERRIAQQKPSPTVTPPVIARKSPPLSPSAADKENENLRQRIAELEKQRQSPPKIDLKNRRELARRTQEALQVLGLYSGNMDGIIGVRTRHAIRGWQKRERYSATGEITEIQIVKLEQEAIQHLANKKLKPQQVAKRPPPKPSPPKRSSTSGSGFFISKLGHVLTNQHVVDNCKKVTVGDNSKKQVTADVMETDRRNDLALLKISSMKMASAETRSLIRKLGIKIVPLASDGLLRSEGVELGEDVLVAGYPYGEIFSNSIKVTKGIVSASRGLGDDTGQFQMDAAVQPGNSGGPIYDENGNIVGVVVAQLNKMKFAKVTGSMPENVNFGIKASTVRQFLTSSGLPTKWSKRSKSMSTRELAKIAKNQTVMVVCNP